MVRETFNDSQPWGRGAVAAFGCALSALALAGLSMTAVVGLAVFVLFVEDEKVTSTPVSRDADPCMVTCVARHHDWFWDPSLTPQENTEALQSACNLLCWNP